MSASPRPLLPRFTNNLHLSYFVGVNVDDTYPQGILGGDRNLGPGTIPHNDYGFSPSNGRGKDVTLTITNSVCWSLKMHSAGNPAGAGNLILGDGSAQQITSAGLNRSWLTNAMTPGSKGVPSLRLIFP